MSLIKEQARIIVIKRIEEVLEIAKHLYPEMTGFKYTYKDKRGSSAGSAGYKIVYGERKYCIMINIDMMVRGMVEWNHIFYDTIPHEVAHIVDFVRRGKSIHDKIWRNIAISLGCKGDRCHNLDTTHRGHVLYRVEGFGKINISIMNHRRIQSEGYDQSITCGGGMYIVDKHHYVDMNKTMDSIPENFMKYLDGVVIQEPKQKGVPTKKAIKLWESGYNTWSKFNEAYGKGQYNTVATQYKLCLKFFGH